MSLLQRNFCHFVNLFWRHRPFREAIGTPTLDFWWHLPRFKSQGGLIPLLACLRFIWFTSGVTPADLLSASMAPIPFLTYFFKPRCEPYGILDGVDGDRQAQQIMDFLPFQNFPFQELWWMWSRWVPVDVSCVAVRTRDVPDPNHHHPTYQTSCPQPLHLNRSWKNVHYEWKCVLLLKVGR